MFASVRTAYKHCDVITFLFSQPGYGYRTDTGEPPTSFASFWEDRYASAAQLLRALGELELPPWTQARPTLSPTWTAWP